MKNVILISDTWFFSLKNVIGVRVKDSKEKWYTFKKNKYLIELGIMYDEHDFGENRYYTYAYKTKHERNTVIKRFLDMDFNDFKKVTHPAIEFDFEYKED